MHFKKLNIDRRKIDAAIQEWAGLDQKPEPVKKGNGHHYSVQKDRIEVLIIIYLNGDGTTTLNPSAGKNKDASNELAEFIRKKCLITEKKDFGLTFKSVTEENFSRLLSFLLEELKAEITNDKTTSTQRLLKIKGPFNDEITLTYYSNNTIRVQGKPLNLYVEAKLFFYEILTFEEVVEKEAETYKIDINANDIRYELGQYMPKTYTFLEEKIVKIITPSLSLLKLDISLEDYSSFVYPALRGLEGYIRQLLKLKGKENHVKLVGQLGSLFKREDPNKYCFLQDFAKSDIGCDQTCEGLEKAYNYWKSKRHPIFHINKRINMTPIIYDKKTAEALVHETLTLIEETYSKII